MTPLEDLCSVILYNDEENAGEYVITCLMQVFGYSPQMAYKIMSEAHECGYTLAAFEAIAEAETHCDQLNSFGLSAILEKAVS